VLFVSHNMSAVSALCQKGLLLERGRLSMCGAIGSAVALYIEIGGNTLGSVSLLGHAENRADEIKFEGLSIYQSGEGPLGCVTTDADVEVRIVYQIRQPIRGIAVELAVELADGQCLLCTSDIDTALHLNAVRLPGRYVASCFLPSALLRAGRYHLTCGAGRPNLQQLTLIRQVLAFDVMDPNGVEIRAGQRRVGLLSPRLPWSVSPAEAVGNGADGAEPARALARSVQ
jgi:lipopolysaccharide transport system ATP-binding protein